MEGFELSSEIPLSGLVDIFGVASGNEIVGASLAGTVVENDDGVFDVWVVSLRKKKTIGERASGSVIVEEVAGGVVVVDGLEERS